MKFQNQVLSLHSDALAADTLMVAKLSGQERMSGLFRFELDLICSDSELDLEAVLYAPAKLGIKVQVKIAGGQIGTSTREIAGVFEEFEQLEEGQGWTKYRAVLVPKLWNTTRSYRSRIFQEMTIEDVIQAVLEKDGLDPQLDFEFQLQRHNDEDPESRPIYPQREYVVQYEESDWTFLARWLEHEGIYFYFTNEDGEEKVVFADTESAYAASAFGDSYPYRPEAKGEGTDSDKFTEEEIRSFRCKQTRLPTQVTVNDYNCASRVRACTSARTCAKTAPACRPSTTTTSRTKPRARRSPRSARKSWSAAPGSSTAPAAAAPSAPARRSLSKSTSATTSTAATCW